MTTRTGFRPRPLDTARQLNIVRDIKELDDGEQKVSRDIVHSHEALDKDNEEARMVSSKQAKGGKEIPIPDVRIIPSYGIEYLPVHKEPRVYIRGKAGVGWQEDDEVDYDLSQEDREWLGNFNRGQERLPFRRLELLLWRLDTANAEATESALLAAGAAELERRSVSACATTDHMSRDQAMEALTQVAAVRQPVKDAVYQFWQDKRKRLGKPLLRRLQAPTNPSDTNPHSCFRPREKVNKPMLRNRRRGNDVDSLQKLATIRQNQQDAIKTIQLLIKRERKKRDIVYAGVDLQQYQLKMRHEPGQAREAVEAEYAAAIKLTAKGGRRPVGFDAKSEKAAQREAEGAAQDPVAAVVRKAKKRRRDTSRIQSIAALPAPPLPTEPEMLFASPVSLAPIPQQAQGSSAMPSFDFTTCCARIGRGGRLIMSRCQPFSYEPLELQQPAEDTSKLPFDLSAPYIAAAQASAQVPKALGHTKQQPQAPTYSKQASPAAAQPPTRAQQQQQHSPAARSTTPAASPGPQSQAQAQQQPQSQPQVQSVGASAISHGTPAQPALQQTRQQQAQAQSQAQLIEMPIQPGASHAASVPAKSKLASMKKGGTPSAANGRSTPGSNKRGPGRPPKKQGSTVSSTSNGASKGASPMDLS